MMEAVYAWAKGSSFSEICDICGMFEGSIIRCIRRLHELLKQLRDASIAVGSHDMAKQLENGFKLIEHGIPFAASLYL